MSTQSNSFVYTPTSSGTYTWRFRRVCTGATAPASSYTVDNLKVSYVIPYTRTECPETDLAYRFGFNGKEKESDMYGESNAYDFINRIADVRIGKYLSLDPLQAKYPMLSPYSVQADNPILFIDKDGKENVIYLVIADNSVSPAQAKAIAAKATENFRTLGLKTEVVYYDKKMTKESYTQLDKSDGVAVIGQRDNVVNAVHSFNPKSAEDLKYYNFGYGNTPEVSDNMGNVIALETQKTKDFAKDVGGNETFESAAAMEIVHGRGHNAGLNHQNEATKIHDENGIRLHLGEENTIMSDGREIMKEQKGFAPFINSKHNIKAQKDYIAPVEGIKKKFGNANADAKLIDKSNRNPKFGNVRVRGEN